MARRPSERVQRELDERPTDSREAPEGRGDRIDRPADRSDSTILQGDGGSSFNDADADADAQYDDTNVTVDDGSADSDTAVVQGDADSSYDDTDSHLSYEGYTGPDVTLDVDRGMWSVDRGTPDGVPDTHVGDGSGTEVPPPSDGPPNPELPDVRPDATIDPDADNPGVDDGFGAGSGGGSGVDDAPSFGSGAGVNASASVTDHVPAVEPATTIDHVEVEPLDLTEHDAFAADPVEEVQLEVIDDEPDVELEPELLD